MVCRALGGGLNVEESKKATMLALGPFSVRLPNVSQSDEGS